MRNITLVAVTVCLLGLGGSTGRAREPSGSDALVEVLRITGIANDGWRETQRAVARLQDLRLEGEHAKRRDAVLKELKGDMSAKAYAAWIAPVFESVLGEGDADELLELFSKPVARKWFALQEELADEKAESLARWRVHVSQEFFQRFSGQHRDDSNREE